MRRIIRLKHYSLRTGKAYLHWVKRYILFHGKRHPQSMGANEVTAFLSSLAVDRHCAPETQNQALNAILFLYPPGGKVLAFVLVRVAVLRDPCVLLPASSFIQLPDALRLSGLRVTR
jgi:hypothetical protein